MFDIKMVNVESSNIESIGFKDHTLYVQFTDGTAYKYEAVPDEVHEALMKAESKGKYLASHIKNHYKYERI